MNNSDFLGKEKILKLLLKLSIPASIAMIVSSLYNVVDTAFVGKGVGSLAIAALSIAFPIQMLISAVSQAIGTGAASLISIRLGQKKKDLAAKTCGTAITASLVTGLILTGFILLFLDPVLKAFGASENILPYAHDYMLYVAPGLFLLSFSMAGNGLVRAEGNARIAMFSMLIGTISNLILDPVFIFGLHMGVKGAAIATVISQFFSFVYLMHFFISGKSILDLERRHFRIKYEIFRESILLGLPNLVQMSGMSLLFLVVNNSLGAYGGDLEISSYGMISKLFSLIIMPLFGIVQGFQPIAGYNYGAGNYKRVKQVLVTGIILSTAVSAVSLVLMNIFPEQLMGLFSNDPELVKSSSASLRIYISALIVLGTQLIGSTYFQAIGKKIPSLILSLSRQFLILMPLLLILPRFMGLKGVWYSFPLSDVISVIVTLAVLLYELKHLNALQNSSKDIKT